MYQLSNANFRSQLLLRACATPKKSLKIIFIFKKKIVQLFIVLLLYKQFFKSALYALNTIVFREREPYVCIYRAYTVDSDCII